ncbi:hypothetical protein [Streptomyces sp. MI02-7b]|uniref:hypothetical protein n=1 Tax=Streptomyces sp. MI02-7b TaxID=462941 RepID=UPI0029B528F8|nr:hypothetical protein [Streptomyces sp. MI02-7b]MDX3076137.1 hypothetical protein [Streptomyces sp. MI02-7b]
MGPFLPYLLLVVCLAAVMGLFMWLATVIRRRGVAGSAVRAAMASYEEAFQVTAHDAHYEIQAQAERKVPVMSPDDPWRSGRPGRRDAGTSRRVPPKRRLRRRSGGLWRARRR